jgi:cyclopropane fatty-acyl-phospholipid synthase-like methyltransferase
VGQFHWQPDRYLALMREEVPAYERLQDETAAASVAEAGTVLELGTGTGETAVRVLAANPGATLHGIDASAEMLAHARLRLPSTRVKLTQQRLEDPLPAGPFELVVSALAVHHLDGRGKAGLFRRVATVLTPGGRFVLGDVVVPEDPADVITPIDGEYDRPSSIAHQLRWLEAAGLRAGVSWRERDLAVIVGERSR